TGCWAATPRPSRTWRRSRRAGRARASGGRRNTASAASGPRRSLRGVRPARAAARRATAALYPDAGPGPVVPRGRRPTFPLRLRILPTPARAVIHSPAHNRTLHGARTMKPLLPPLVVACAALLLPHAPAGDDKAPKPGPGAADLVL